MSCRFAAEAEQAILAEVRQTYPALAGRPKDSPMVRSQCLDVLTRRSRE